MPVLYTIGYAPLTLESLAGYLLRYGVTALADVRSVPRTSFKSEFNGDQLQLFLRQQGIAYVYLGDSLGARYTDVAVLEHGIAVYERIAETDLFRKGLKRLDEGVRHFTVCLLCAEKDPLDCHRAVLVSRQAMKAISGLAIHHILADGSLESHAELEARMCRRYGLDQLLLPLGGGGADATQAEAYRRHGREIAFRMHTDAGAGYG